MKLKTYNSENVQSARESKPLLTIYQKSGVFTFNIAAADLIGLKSQSEVQFHQDDAEQENWYIEVVKANGFKVRISESSTAKQLHFNSSSLGRLITSDGQLNGKFFIAGQPTKHENRKLFGLIRRPKV